MSRRAAAAAAARPRKTAAEAFASVLDVVLAEHFDVYWTRVANEDDRHSLSLFFVAFCKYCDANSRTSDLEASEARANARALLITPVEQPEIAIDMARAAPLHHGEWAWAEASELRPSEIDALESSVLEAYMAQTVTRGALYHEAQKRRENGTFEPRSADQLQVEAFVQFYAGNIIRASHFALLADFMSGQSAREQASAIAALRRLVAALLSSPLADEFPWRTQVFCHYLNTQDLAHRQAARTAQQTRALGALGTSPFSKFGKGGALNDSQGSGGADDEDRPVTPPMAGLSTSKISQWTHDSHSARFDAHGSSQLTDMELADLKARIPAERSIYGLSYEGYKPKADPRSYARMYVRFCSGLACGLGTDV
eukprot:c523_g1_i1.p1 GENE.c523_g1_i1~~c523_g1_i1.p1  ORF type:complete len:369 (-),score=63.02 c523_g1_i1:238-1344(-)